MSDQQYDDELRGALFKNKDKQPGDKRPDYKGFAQVNGVRYEMAAWLRTSQRSNEKFMSFKLELPREQSQGAAPAPQQAAPVVPVVPTPDEDIPFMWDGPILDIIELKAHASRQHGA